MKFYAKNPCYLDYEKPAMEGVRDVHSVGTGIPVDAIELRHSIRFRDCLDSFGALLDGWDCDCVFVMNSGSVAAALVFLLGEESSL